VITGALYLVAHASVALLGLPVLWIPEVRTWSLPARAAAAFAVGAIVLAFESTLLTLLGVAWNPLIVLAPPLLFAVFLARNAKGKAETVRYPFRPGGRAAAFGILAGGAAVGHLMLSLATARATSTDFLLFWGVKAVYFAAGKGVDPEFLRHPWFGHGQPFYPPLVPTLDAWSILAAGRMPWRTAPLVTLLWFVAAALLVLEVQRRRLGDRDATLVATFWMAALSASLVISFSGANAEAPLVLYETAAGMLLLNEGPHPGAGRRFLAGVFLAGAVLTKVEGTVGSGLLILGTVLRDRMVGEGRPRWREMAGLVIPPLCAGLLWWSYVRWFGIPSNYGSTGRPAEMHWGRLKDVIGLVILHLSAGTWWLSWILPLLLILAAAKTGRCREALPGIVAVSGLLAVFVFLYMHETTNQTMRIGWEIPRISQPALSLLIAIAALCFPPGARFELARK
jgi:hypothetical protein